MGARTSRDTMRATRVLLALSCATALVACGLSGPSKAPPIEPAVASPAQVQTPAATATAGTILTPTPSAVSLIVKSCVPSVDGPPDGAAGSLAVYRPSEGLLLLDLQTGDTLATLVGSEASLSMRGFFPYVSPDHHHLAVVEGSALRMEGPHSLRVVDSNGKDVVAPTWQAHWDIVTGWLDNSRLEIAVAGDAPGTMAAYDPFNAAVTELPPRAPEVLSMLPPVPDWYVHTPVVRYDPTLSRAAYVGFPDRTYRLWDLEAERQLWESKYLEWAYDPPAWSPDGSQVAFLVQPLEGFPASGELDVVSRGGELLGSLDFAAADPEGGRTYFLQRLAWSPTGDKIAFWLVRSEGEPSPSLSVFDVATETVAEYCVQGNVAGLPVWSPDGRFIAVGGAIVDTIEERVYPLDGGPVGWLAPTG